MPSKYFTILTNIGSALHANAQIQQTKVPWTHMALGDGGGVDVQPDQKQTGLVREVHRLPITAIDPHPTNPNWIVVEAVVPNNVGGWTVRETAIYGGTGIAQCIAVGNYPASYKPVLAEGAVREMVMRMIVEISSTATVNLVIDPAVAIASRDYVDNTLKAELQKQGHKSTVRAATVSAVALNGLRSIDGVSLAAGDRVLVKDQADAKENGIYVIAESAWTRAADSDTGAKLKAGSFVVVTEGDFNADTMWMLRTDGDIVIGTTATSWQWMAGANAPDQAPEDSSRKVANTAFVAGAVAEIKGVYEPRIATLEDTYGLLTHTGAATLTGADNKILLAGIVKALKLEKGDVIQIVGGGPNNGKLHTVESISGNDTIVVNYEHCGSRGNGKLKLINFAGQLTVKRIAKWHSAAQGVGQDWVTVTEFLANNTDRLNSSGRMIAVSIYTHISVITNGASLEAQIDGVVRARHDTLGMEDGQISLHVGRDSNYKLIAATFELGASVIVSEMR